MTKTETGKILALMREMFPQGKDITAETIKAWHWLIGECDYAIAEQAVKELAMKYEGYSFPAPAHLIEEIRLISGNKADYGKLWDALVRAAKNSTYGAKEEFEKLPPDVQRFLGSPTVLKDFGLIEPNVLQTVVKASFNKTMPKIVEQREVQERLPDEIRQAITEAKQRMIDYDSE